MRKIVLYGDPVLREQAKPIESVDQSLHELADEMLEIMHGADGIGLAAQQIGETRAICVIDVPPDHDVDEAGNRLNPELDMPLVLLNPVLSDPSTASDTYQEGCLSFPGVQGQVVRPDEVSVVWKGMDGEEHTARVRGLVGRCIQHEVDHLNGVLFIDHMSHVKRVALRGKLKRLKNG